MNINDIKENILIPKNIWKEIFCKQMDLAIKYKEIENMGDLLETKENNINTAKGQKWIKDFAWRVTEELAEAWEAYNFVDDKTDDKNKQFMEHFKEELIDALHFLVELTIIAGYVNFRPQNFITPGTTEPWDVIYELGLMCNTLKNKPWKQTQMLTDKNEFTKYLNNAWNYMYALLKQEIGTDKNIYLYYFKKNKVNQFRQRSNY